MLKIITPCNRKMFYSAVQAFTAFVVTVINNIPHHKVLMLVDCLGLFRLVPFYGHMCTHKHTTQINSIRLLLHEHTLPYFYSQCVCFFYSWVLMLCPGTDTKPQFLPSQNEHNAIAALLEIMHLLCKYIQCIPSTQTTTVHF